MSPTTPDASRGKNALVLWAVGDLTFGAGTFLRDPSISSALVRLEQLRGTATVRLTIAGNTVSASTASVNELLFLWKLNNDIDTSRQDLTVGTTIACMPLATQTLTLILEGTQVGTGDANFTGWLVVEDRATEKPVLQGMVRCRYKKEQVSGRDEVSILLIDDVFWSSRLRQTQSGTRSIPEIRVPDVDFASRSSGQKKSDSFAVVPFRVEPTEADAKFVRLCWTRQPDAIGLQRIDEEDVPLIPELEPSRMQTPPRLAEGTVRVAHRRFAGLAVRPNIPTERYRPVIDTDQGRVEIPTLSSVHVLDTIVGSETEGLNRLPPEGWLVHAERDLDIPLTTEGLFTLNPDLSAGSPSILTAVESRTQDSALRPVNAGADRLRFRALLREAGAQGVAVQFRARDDHAADIGFVDSPFYDHVGTPTAVEHEDSRTTQTLGTSLQGYGQSSGAVPVSPWLHATDPRFLLPSDLARDRTALLDFRYALDEQPQDPNADVCCLAHRHYRLRRLGTATVVVEKIDVADTPILHVADVPAYRHPTRLAHSGTGRWLRSNIPLSNAFFPRLIDWETAAEKPGAMMQTLIQGRLTGADGHSLREPRIDFTQREPQFIRLGNCVTAAVDWVEDATSLVYSSTDQVANATLVWNETIGTVPVNKLDANGWIQFKDGRLNLTGNAPLQLVEDFNSDLVSIRSSDAAVPAYRVESQKDDADPAVNIHCQPAKMWAITKADLGNVSVPPALTATEFPNLSVTGDGTTWKTNPGSALQSGTLLKLRDFDGAAAVLNGDRRLVRIDSSNDYTVMQNTVHVLTGNIDDLVDVEFNGGPGKQAKIVAHRPFCISFTNLDPADQPEASTNVIMTFSTEPLTIHREDDSEPLDPTDLRLLPIAPGAVTFLVLTPTPATNVTNTVVGNAIEPAPAPVGYLEFFPRTPVMLALDEANVWTPAVTFDTSMLRASYVRIPDAVDPHQKGVFSLIKLATDLGGLARPTCEPLLREEVPLAEAGTATNFLDAEPESVDITHVDGPSPVRVKLDHDPAWAEGTAVAVDVVVPQTGTVGQTRSLVIKSTFVVRRLDDGWYELHTPITASKLADPEVFVSAVVPLADAFEQLQAPAGGPDHHLSSLKLDPEWNPTDRPILQVHWSAAVDLSVPPGGLPWKSVGVSTALYEQPKQVKFLANMQLYPKLAFVLSMEREISSQREILFQRTILFGDSPPPFDARPRIEPDGVGAFKFVLEIPLNRESVTVPLRLPMTSSTRVESVLYVVKSLPSGIAVYDRMVDNDPPVQPPPIEPESIPFVPEPLVDNSRWSRALLLFGALAIAWVACMGLTAKPFELSWPKILAHFGFLLAVLAAGANLVRSRPNRLASTAGSETVWDVDRSLHHRRREESTHG
jgi:hypothetical protein